MIGDARRVVASIRSVRDGEPPFRQVPETAVAISRGISGIQSHGLHVIRNCLVVLMLVGARCRGCYKPRHHLA